jgi:hypothetical protein
VAGCAGAGYASGMRWGILVVFLAAACKGPLPVFSGLDRVEASLALSPAQRPAWEAFRREAEAADSPRAAWRRELREAMDGERFDPRRAQAAADAGRDQAGRLIEAWARLDAALTPAQRAAVRSQLTPE